MTDTAEWLESIGLGEYAQRFADNAIDMSILRDLTDQDLKELATAKSRGAASAHGKPFHPGINETTSRPTAADPYYRLSDSYHGLFDFYVVPPSSPGYSYGHVRMPLR
jgi:hypothetical protein